MCGTATHLRCTSFCETPSDHKHLTPSKQCTFLYKRLRPLSLQPNCVVNNSARRMWLTGRRMLSERDHAAMGVPGQSHAQFTSLYSALTTAADTAMHICTLICINFKSSGIRAAIGLGQCSMNILRNSHLGASKRIDSAARGGLCNTLLHTKCSPCDCIRQGWCCGHKTSKRPSLY